MHTIAIIGRPNVGKSTLFNRLTKKWQAIVEAQPAITRDRLYGACRIADRDVVLIDTGGLSFDAKTQLEKKVRDQALVAIEESDLILFVLDGRAGVTPVDRDWIRRVRKIDKPKIFLVNKLDSPSLDERAREFFELGVEPLVPISFENQRNFSELYERICEGLNADKRDESRELRPKFSIAIIGRPNVGKSTLLNSLLKEERCVVDDAPGTTRDPVSVDYLGGDNKTYRIIDTAGIRRRAKTSSRVEKFSVVQSLNTIERADVILLLIDSITGPTDQDAHVAGYAFKKGKAIVLIANKWDEGQHKFTRETFTHALERKMNYLSHCPLLFISAKTGKNLGQIFSTINKITKQLDRRIKTSQLNKVFESIVAGHPPPMYKGQEIKMYYSTQVNTRPPSFVVFCNYPKKVHFTYRRYVRNALRENFELHHVPVRVIFKER